jgi:hypothetical protein
MAPLFETATGLKADSTWNHRADEVRGNTLASGVLVDRGLVGRALLLATSGMVDLIDVRAMDLVRRLRATTGPWRVGHHQLAVVVAPAVNLCSRRRGTAKDDYKKQRRRTRTFRCLIGNFRSVP